MKHLIFVVLSFILLFSLGCSRPDDFSGATLADCTSNENGHATFVAYESGVTLRMWFHNNKTGIVYQVMQGGTLNFMFHYYMPTISVGDVVDVQYCNGRIFFDSAKFYTKKRRVNQGFYSLSGFEYLNTSGVNTIKQ